MGTSQSGFSLVEVSVGLTLFTVGFAGLSALLVSNEQTQRLATQEAQVANVLRAEAERIRATPFEEIAATHGGSTFPVDPVGGNGSVSLFLDETDTSPEAQQLGFPRDLDGDGFAASPNVSGDYQLLPVKLEVQWTDERGNRSKNLYFFLARDD